MSQHPPVNPHALPKRTITDLAGMKARGEKIAMVTAYDAPSARLADAAGVDVALVGDSAAMTVLGYDSTLPVTMEEMVMLVSAVRRGAARALVVADMPFGAFQASDESAVLNAVRFVKEAGADAVKVEGAGPMLRRITSIVDAGIPVFGHIGLTPQSIKALGTYRLQARTAEAAQKLIDVARSVERAGCVGVVLEAIPGSVAAHITRTLTIPTVGIGAGPSCDGQVLVWHDLLGLTPGRLPRFVKRYDELGSRIESALRHYVDDVRAGAFPGEGHTYTMAAEEQAKFEALLCEPPLRRP
jgi:3-methyl-2-oxobutanoate hydroxymethyltransferase